MTGSVAGVFRLVDAAFPAFRDVTARDFFTIRFLILSSVRRKSASS
jgi:hypothetical protein